jgi:hypothetical protein
MADGTVAGALRAPLDLSKLVPYLEQNIAGFKGPVEPKQFGVSTLFSACSARSARR